MCVAKAVMQLGMPGNNKLILLTRTNKRFGANVLKSN